MGYDLSNSAGDAYQWKVVGWWYLINIARHCGWSPAGTMAPNKFTDSDPWDGNYFHNESQLVSAQDAASLADALDRFISSPDRESIAASVGRRMDKILEDQNITPETKLPDLDPYPLDVTRQMFARFKQTSVGRWSFDAKSDNYLRGFIAFCRKGEFAIE